MDDLLITSSSAMETLIRLYFAEVNLGNVNSLIPLVYNVIHVTEVSPRKPLYVGSCIKKHEKPAIIVTRHHGCRKPHDAGNWAMTGAYCVPSAVA